MKENNRQIQNTAWLVIRNVLAERLGESEAVATEGRLLDVVRLHGAETVALDLCGIEAATMASHEADAWTPTKRAGVRMFYSTLRAAARGIEREQFANLASMRRCNDPALPSLQAMLSTLGLGATLEHIKEQCDAALDFCERTAERSKTHSGAVYEMAATSPPKRNRRKQRSRR